jgi:hypothetical protein
VLQFPSELLGNAAGLFPDHLGPRATRFIIVAVLAMVAGVFALALLALLTEGL